MSLNLKGCGNTFYCRYSSGISAIHWVQRPFVTIKTGKALANGVKMFGASIVKVLHCPSKIVGP